MVTEMVQEKFIYFFDHLTWQMAEENFINFSHCNSLKSYITNLFLPLVLSYPHLHLQSGIVSLPPNCDVTLHCVHWQT